MVFGPWRPRCSTKAANGIPTRLSVHLPTVIAIKYGRPIIAARIGMSGSKWRNGGATISTGCGEIFRSQSLQSRFALKENPKVSTESPWLIVGPEVGYWGVRRVSELWQPKTLYISENGASADDPLVNGRIDDADRVMYLRNYVGQFHRAVAEGYPLKGYFLWSLMDNFEWADGYTKRFGIHYTDFKTQQRIPKLSAAWYREVIRQNRLV